MKNCYSPISTELRNIIHSVEAAPYTPLLGSSCFSFLQTSCRHSHAHLSWNKYKSSSQSSQTNTKLRIPSDKATKHAYCIHWCSSSHTVFGVISSGVAWTPPFGQITTGLWQTVRAQESDLTWERSVSNVLEMSLCTRRSERPQTDDVSTSPHVFHLLATGAFSFSTTRHWININSPLSNELDHNLTVTLFCGPALHLLQMEQLQLLFPD